MGDLATLSEPDSGTLVRFNSAIDLALQAVVEADDPAQLARMSDWAEDLRILARRAQLGIQAQRRALRVRLEAERRIGQLMQQIDRAPVGRPKKGFPKPNLASIGLNKTMSQRARLLGALPQRKYEVLLGRIETDTEITLTQLLGLGSHRRKQAETDSSWGWGRHPKPMALNNVDFAGASTEWLTPPEIFEAMGVEFSLDVASPGPTRVPWIPAREHYTKCQNGLVQPWRGPVWMNCPFGVRNGIMMWIDRFLDHRNGVALVPDFTSTEWWQHLTRHADAVLFVRPKIQFLPRQPGRPGNALGSTLVAIGPAGVRALQNAEGNGRGVCFYRDLRKPRRIVPLRRLKK